MKFRPAVTLIVAIFTMGCGALYAPATAQPAGQKIYFSVEDGTFTNLKIEGTDPNEEWKTWRTDPSTVLTQVITEDQRWKGTVVLVFDVVNKGSRSCVIDDLHDAPGSTMAVVTYTEGVGCSGESGSPRQLGAEEVLFEYMRARDGLKMLELAGSAKDGANCLSGIAEGFTKGLWGQAMMIVDCGGATLPVMNEILLKYNLRVTDSQDIVTPLAGITPGMPAPASTATLTSTSPPVAVSSLRGTVLELSNCRYGPGAPYLYKYGVGAGTRMEIIGRDADGNWLQVRGIGGKNACWIKASQIQADGDVAMLPDAYPVTMGLPISPFFDQITITGNSSSAGTVSVEWLEHIIRSDLSTEQGIEYIVEVWTCVDGKPNFTPIGTNDTSASFDIDSSCGFASHADLIGEDKEGFSIPTPITLP